MKKRICIIMSLFSIASLILSCTLTSNLGKKEPELSQTEVLETALQGARQTMESNATSVALTHPPTSTPEPTATNPPTPTATASPTATIQPTPSNTVVPTPCYKAKFVTDVTIPDGKEMKPGETFVKTWRITNVGSCTWTPSYQLIFSDGERMSAPSSVSFPANISPGSSVDLSVQLTSPNYAGSYTAKFLLKAPDGTIFGVGDKNSPVTAVIKVVVPKTPTPNLPAKGCSVTSNSAYVYSNGDLYVEAIVENTGSKAWSDDFVIAPVKGEEYFEGYFFSVPGMKTGNSFLFQKIGFDDYKGYYPIYITWEIMDPNNNWETYCVFSTDYIP